MSMIEARSVSRCYGHEHRRVTAVRNVDLSVEVGERVSIVGRSGSGKSTLLNLLAGLDRPSEGTLTIDSRELHELSRRQMADFRLRSVGMVFQSFQLIPQRTALQNVELPLIIRGERSTDRRGRAAEWLHKVGLTSRSTHFPYELSGGEQQRVAIARALVNCPRLLLADEPTGNLDSATADDIINLLIGLCAESEVTFVLVTHDQLLADRFGHRRFLMSDGVLSEPECESERSRDSSNNGVGPTESGE